MISRFRNQTLALSLMAAALLAGGSARAQSRFSTLRFKPAAAPVNFFVTEAGRTLPHLSPSVGVYLHYDHRPLQVVSSTLDIRLYNEIAYQLNLEAMVAFGLWDRIEIGAVLPVVLTQQSGERASPPFPPQPSLGAGIGDIRLIPKLRLFTVGPLSVAVAAAVEIPTGNNARYLGDDGVGIEPRGIVGLDWELFGFALNAGVRLRPTRTFTFGTAATGTNVPQVVTVDDEFMGSVGLRAGWPDRVEIIGDVFGYLSLKQQDAEEMALEALGGVRFHMPYGFVANLAAGPGFGRGVGTPAWRVLGGLHWYRRKDAPKQIGDRDGDGILDDVDKCPDEPEDKDGFEDEDGCPDPDNDQDGILDVDDKCPDEPEDKDGFEDRDGCPDPDNDQDGIKDPVDKCPDDPEDEDGFEDLDGCPDPDNDRDGILDKDDKCINEPETFNGVDDDDGCPDKGKGPVQIQHGQITVPAVYFATAKDRILRRSFPVLLRVAELIKSNRWIIKIRVEGHTDSRGSDSYNLDLSQRRARSVYTFLVDKGVPAERLEHQGYGETQPVASNSTRGGRSKNRRVDFVIVDPARKAPEPAAE